MLPRHTQTKDGCALTIRRALPSDAAEIVAHVEKISAETDNLTFGAGEFGITVEQETETLARALEGNTQLFLVALIDGAIVGLLNLAVPPRPRRAHIGEFGMDVEAAHWGKGVGGALLDAALAWARDVGLTKINLRVRVDNARAIALYESRGFTLEGTLTRELRIRGAYVDNHCMGLAL